MDNGRNEPFGGVPVLGAEEPPTFGRFDFEGISFRWGAALTDEGEPAGVVLEWWFPITPWFKFRMPFGMLEARGFQAKLAEALEDAAKTET